MAEHIKHGIRWPHRPYFSSHENPALKRVRADIAKSQDSHREVQRMLDFLWRMSRLRRPYSYYENDHASRILYRWLRVYGFGEI